MRPQYIMFMGLVFSVGTFVSLTFGGVWLGSPEVDVANAVSVFKQANILGIWSVTVPNITFFLVGLKALMMMDFAFFQGTLIQWFAIMILGLGLMWGVFIVVIGTIQGLFRRV